MEAAFLGFDFSTQQIKVVVTDDDLNTIHSDQVDFNSELPQYGTDHGVHKQGDQVTSPVLMWIEAFDILLEKLKQKVILSQVKAVSGAGQQHGSVYWRQGGIGQLGKLDPNKKLCEQLQDCFSVSDSPIWMDSSTSEQCRKLEDAVGGAEALCQLTGSRAFHRFTGNQIAKIFQTQPEAYEKTEFISLVSSFGCSLLLGGWAPIDYADASGMNLMDVRSHEWVQKLLDAAAPDLSRRLGQPVPAKTVLGSISPYYVNRYGLPANCQVVAFTGDNPASLAGLNMSHGDLAVSFGTSDTVFAWLTEALPQLGMHVLVNPVQSDQYMGMLCFKNGAFTRDRVRRTTGCADWQVFSDRLSDTEAGNHGYIGCDSFNFQSLFYDYAEILPEVPAGTHLFDSDDIQVSELDAPTLSRAVIEHQCLAKRLHAQEAGYKLGGRVLVTGGASSNLAILQILSDVLQSPVYTQDVVNSAALGSAFRAKHALAPDGTSLNDVCGHSCSFQLACKPNAQHSKMYDDMCDRYARLETNIKVNYGQK